MELFNINKKLLYAKIITVKLKPSLLLNLLIAMHLPTHRFTEALRLAVTVG